jgi:hypothetical protein
MRAKRGVLIGGLFLVLLLLLWSIFYYTGGVGLVRLYRNYLSQDIADKKFTWQDFTDRGATEKLSGYYGGRVGNSIYIWTLGGLRRFGYKAGHSAYYYMDVCGIVRQLAVEREKRAEGAESGKEKKVQYSEAISFNPTDWDRQAKRGDYVVVVRTEEEPRIVSQLYGSSNQYFPLTQLRTGLCGE